MKMTSIQLERSPSYSISLILNQWFTAPHSFGMSRKPELTSTYMQMNNHQNHRASDSAKPQTHGALPNPNLKHSPTPLPEGWEEATIIYGGRRYPFIYNPDTRRVHAPGFPQFPLHGIQLHTGEILTHFDLRWDVETELGYAPGDEDQPPRPPIGWKPVTPAS